MTLRRLAAVALLTVAVTGVHAADPAPAPEAPAPAAAAAPGTVAEGRRVTVELTVKTEDGTQVHSTKDEEPVVYTHGKGELLPALEAAIVGMHADETKTVQLPPEKGYGVVDPSMVIEEEAARLPEAARKEGVVLVGTDPAGNKRPVRVAEVKGDKVMLDFNHPLAGHTLTFDVKVLKVE